MRIQCQRCGKWVVQTRLCTRIPPVRRHKCEPIYAHVLQTMLVALNIHVDDETAKGWEINQRLVVKSWARAMLLRTTGHRARVPLRPAFLPPGGT